MRKLRVTWQDGSWNRNGDQPVASANLWPHVTVAVVGETLTFRSGDGIELALPESRLISAVIVEVDA